MKVVLITASMWIVFSYLLPALRPASPVSVSLAPQSSVIVTPPPSVAFGHDEFTGARVVRLLDVPIISVPDHTLKMEMETKVNDSSPAAQMLSEEPSALVMFTSLSAQGRDFGDRELHFLVDGKPLRVGVAAESPSFPNPDEQATSWRVGCHLNVVIPFANLEQIVQGRSVRMRLGSVETTLPSATLTSLRSFVNAAARANKKEGAR